MNKYFSNLLHITYFGNKLERRATDVLLALSCDKKEKENSVQSLKQKKPTEKNKICDPLLVLFLGKPWQKRPRVVGKIFLSASELFTLPACGNKTENTMTGASQICT